jgi:hypothetical protein
VTERGLNRLIVSIACRADAVAVTGPHHNNTHFSFTSKIRTPGNVPEKKKKGTFGPDRLGGFAFLSGLRLGSPRICPDS